MFENLESSNGIADDSASNRHVHLASSCADVKDGFGIDVDVREPVSFPRRTGDDQPVFDVDEPDLDPTRECRPSTSRREVDCDGSLRSGLENGNNVWIGEKAHSSQCCICLPAVARSSVRS